MRFGLKGLKIIIFPKKLTFQMICVSYKKNMKIIKERAKNVSDYLSLRP